MSIPATYIARWLALLARRGVTTSRALATTSLTPEAIADPTARVTLAELIEVMQVGAALTDDPSLGLELGLSLKPSAHSWYGYAVMSAPTLREAIELGARYIGLRASPWCCHVTVEDGTAVMQFDESYPLGPARILILEALLGATIALGEVLLGHSLAHPDIEFRADYPEQPHHARFADRVPRVVYSSPALQARFPAAWLDRRLSFAEPLANAEAVAALDRELERTAPQDNWVDRVRTMLADPTHGFPALDAAALRLHTSGRSLRRHLQVRGTTYQTLRDAARRAHAITLLERSRCPIDDIAVQLGYADAAGFTRAFSRWTGDPPSSYRKLRR